MSGKYCSCQETRVGYIAILLISFMCCRPCTPMQAVNLESIKNIAYSEIFHEIQYLYSACTQPPVNVRDRCARWTHQTWLYVPSVFNKTEQAPSSPQYIILITPVHYLVPHMPMSHMTPWRIASPGHRLVSTCTV